MGKINIETVTARFCELAHLTAEESENYSATVASARAYFERLFTREPNAAEQSLCDYACACKAFYDYTVLRAATAKTYSTQSGGVYARVSDDDTVKHAENLWHNSLAALPEDLVRDCCFIFEGVRG